MIEGNDEIQICGEYPKGRYHESPATKFSCTINASDESELRVYLKAHDYLSALRELEYQLRHFYKYGFPPSITPGDAVDKIRDMFYKKIEDYGIDLTEGN